MAWFVVAVAFGLGGYYVYGSSARPDIMANVGRDADFEPVHLPVWIVAGLNLFILLKCQTVLVPTSRPIVAYVVDNPGRGGHSSVLSTQRGGRVGRPSFRRFVLSCSDAEI